MLRETLNPFSRFYAELFLFSGRKEQEAEGT